MKTYEIRTFSDLLKVPIDRRSACLLELEYALQLYEFALGSDAEAIGFEALQWTDDGGMSARVVDTISGESLALKVTNED